MAKKPGIKIKIKTVRHTYTSSVAELSSEQIEQACRDYVVKHSGGPFAVPGTSIEVDIDISSVGLLRGALVKVDFASLTNLS